MRPRLGVLIGAIASFAVVAGAMWAVFGIPMQPSGQLAVTPIHVQPPSGNVTTPTPSPVPTERDHSGPATQVAPPPSHDVGDDHGGTRSSTSGKDSGGGGGSGGGQGGDG